MTLRIGNKYPRARNPLSGVTFIEVMVAAVILSVGLVAIYRSFFIGADLMVHLANRLHALNLLENRGALVERDFRALHSPDIGALTQEVEVQGRPMEFRYNAELKPVGSLLSVFEFDSMVSWQEHGRDIRLSRFAYFSGISSLEPVEVSP